MIEIKLRQVMENYETKNGHKTTYSEIAKATGLSKATVEAIGSRSDYNTTLTTIDALCAFFECELEELLEYHQQRS